MSDTFLGAWLVSEYVYNPNGRFVGLVRQRRELRQLANGRIRVMQHCQPEASLAGHPMARFAGEWEFELSVNGRFRHYHGPDVIGSGTVWHNGVMSGSGVWPVFGHNFRSFSILVSPTRQLTGGKFFNGSEMVANIVGVATPETPGDDWPTLDQCHWSDVSTWQGGQHTTLADGTPDGEQTVNRYYQGSNGRYSVQMGEHQMELIEENGRWRVSGCWQGIGKLIGPLLEIEAYGEAGVQWQLLELHDAQTHQRIGLHYHYQDGLLKRVISCQLSAGKLLAVSRRG